MSRTSIIVVPGRDSSKDASGKTPTCVFDLYSPEIAEESDGRTDLHAPASGVVRRPVIESLEHPCRESVYLRYRFVQHRFTAPMLSIEAE